MCCCKKACGCSDSRDHASSRESGKREYHDDDRERREYLDDYYQGQGYREYTDWERQQRAIDDEIG